MAYIKEYWDNKESRAEKAKNHTQIMSNEYTNEINNTIKETKIYSTEFKNTNINKNDNIEIIIEDLDSVSAIFKHSKGKTAVLNFSSYKNAGGMFFNGSKAQEECLCHESYLYNVLSTFEETFYKWNNLNKNKALYFNRALYSPNVLFFKNNQSVPCDVITCACPNRSAAQKYQNVSDRENLYILSDRIRYVLDIASDNNVDTLILGAYGCGVFGQEATDVAALFKNYLSITHKSFDKVIFAIPNGRDNNLEKFKSIFSK